MNNRKPQTALWEWKILNQEYWSWPRQYECSLNPAHLNSTVLHPTVHLNCWSVAVHLERYVIQTGMHFTFLFRYRHHDVLAAPWRCRYGAAATLKWHLLQGGQFDKPRICHTVLQDSGGGCPDHHILFCGWEVSQSDRTILQVSICSFFSILCTLTSTLICPFGSFLSSFSYLASSVGTKQATAWKKDLTSSKQTYYCSSYVPC